MLIIVALNQWNFQFIQIIGELMTIPMIAVVLGSILYAIIQLVRNTGLKYTLPILFLSMITLGIIIIATINQL
ncbi:hypothetical protein NMS_1759 [Nonlabens marinus S1-08]|uniref:Uncharacterized protein n=1 Tax=Nonlabens marinus S1-08 TaxID=1454201 RepID=W8VVU6_9FLAO|nr:hypothetical protein NMS_1759 [Nonlabens marinus S1-08]